MAELETRLRDHLRTALGERHLEFAERPIRLTGGFDTQIFAFRLAAALAAFSGPLILRLLDAHHDPTRALRERATQNALADLGYPAPRVLLATADVTLLGGAFLIMQRLAGQPLPKVRIGAIASVLAGFQARLHDLDPVAFLRAVTREGLEPRSFTPTSRIWPIGPRVADSAGSRRVSNGWPAAVRPAPSRAPSATAIFIPTTS